MLRLHASSVIIGIMESEGKSRRSSEEVAKRGRVRRLGRWQYRGLHETGRVAANTGRGRCVRQPDQAASGDSRSCSNRRTRSSTRRSARHCR